MSGEIRTSQEGLFNVRDTYRSGVSSTGQDGCIQARMYLKTGGLLQVMSPTCKHAYRPGGMPTAYRSGEILQDKIDIIVDTCPHPY
jgi:hypothetical protein